MTEHFELGGTEAELLASIRPVTESVAGAAPGLLPWEPPAESLTNGAGPSPADSDAVVVYTEDDLAHLPAVTWDVDHVIPRGGNVLIVGKKSAFKTFVALDLTACIANGMDWHGHATQTGMVVYITGEGGPGFHRRLRGWRLLHQRPAAGIYVVRTALSLVTVTTAGRLARGIERKLGPEALTRPLVVVFDTLHRSIKGEDENASETVGLVHAVLDCLRESFPTVTAILVHHPGKAGSEGRGSSAWEDDADCVWTVEREAKDSMTVELKNTKQKDDEEHAPITLELAPVDLGDNERPVLAVAPPVAGAAWGIPAQHSLTAGERKALQVLDDFRGEPISWTRWAKAGEMGDSTLSKYRKRLLDLGYAAASSKPVRYAITPEGTAALL